MLHADDRNHTGADTTEFVRNRIQIQEEHMRKISNIFGGRVLDILPFLQTEVKGNRTIDDSSCPGDVAAARNRESGDPPCRIELKLGFRYFSR